MDRARHLDSLQTALSDQNAMGGRSPQVDDARQSGLVTLGFPLNGGAGGGQHRNAGRKRPVYHRQH